MGKTTHGQHSTSPINQKRITAERIHKDKIKEQPQFKGTKPEVTDVSKVLVKADRHPRLALVDLQT